MAFLYWTCFFGRSDECMPILDSCYNESPDYVYYHELDIKQSFVNLETGILLGKGCFCMKGVLQTSPSAPS